MLTKSSIGNQIFYCTRCITPIRVTSLRGSSRVVGPRITAPFEEMLQQWRAVGNTAI